MVKPRCSSPQQPRSARPAAPVPAPTTGPDPRPLLLASGLDKGEVGRILRAYGIRQVAEADVNLQAMADEPHHRRQLAEILPLLLDAVGRTADPDQALNHWERLLGSVTRSSFLDHLRSSPRMVDLLSTIFGTSDSLAFTLIRDPMLIYWLADSGVLDQQPHARALGKSLDAMLRNVTVRELRLDALRRFKRKEMLRIGVRDVLRLAGVPETTEALAQLASVLIQAAYEIVVEDMRNTYGVPRHRNAQGRWVETGFAVIGMGKLGGCELNYSSDVDLIYVYDSEDGQTMGLMEKGARGERTAVRQTSNEEYFERVARELTHVLTDVTKEGAVFRVDLRLRAEGTVGQLARSIDSYARYYQTRGQTWERMALLKASPVAGSLSVGKTFLRRMRRFVLGESIKDVQACRRLLLDVRGVKDMIDRKMIARGHEQRNVKLGTGGIREIEFIVQSVQLLCANRLPQVWHRGTLASLRQFQSLGLLRKAEAEGLRDAYVFLRDVEHKLQMVHELQTHALPDDADELMRCAVRLGYATADREKARLRMMEDHRRHTEFVNEVFKALLLYPDRSPLFAQIMKRLRLPLAS